LSRLLQRALPQLHGCLAERRAVGIPITERIVLDAAPSRERASAVVLALVDGLNRLDGRHGGMIDTIRREGL